MKIRRPLLLHVATLLLTGLWLAGCEGLGGPNPLGTPQPQQPVPPPVNYMLPKTIRIHPFTGTRAFDEGGGIRGIDARVEALDYFGDATKAFGDFRFELYDYRINNPDPKGARRMVWEEKLNDPKANRVHWDDVSRSYQFKLEWSEGVPVGQKFVLVAIFSSPFTERRFAQRVFTSGE